MASNRFFGVLFDWPFSRSESDDLQSGLRTSGPSYWSGPDPSELMPVAAASHPKGPVLTPQQTSRTFEGVIAKHTAAHHDFAAFDISERPFLETKIGDSAPGTGADAFDRSEPSYIGFGSMRLERSLVLPQSSAGHAGHATSASQGTAESVAGDPSGQLWYGGQGSDGGTSSGSSDNQVGHIDSDGAGRHVSDVDTQDNDAGFEAVGLDTSAGVYFALDASGLLRSGHITNDTETNEASQFGTTIAHQSGSELQLTDPSNQDEDNVFTVDPAHHVIYTEIWGKDDDTTAIIKISYDPSTGVMTSPYNSSTGTLTAGSNVLMTYNTTGGKLVDVTAMSFDVNTGKLYYIDDDLGYNHNFGANQVWGPTKNIYVVDTTAANPSSTLTQLTTGLTATDANTYIAGMAVDDAKGIIYYAINTVSTHSTTIYWMPITGGAGTAMAIPGSVTLGFETYYANGSNGMTIDQNTQTLYVGNSTGPTGDTNGNIVQLTLSSDGHSFTGGNSTFEVFDGNANNANTGALLFDNSPVVSNVVGTTTEAVQGGSALQLLAATPGITDVDNVNLGFVQVQIANAQAGDVLSATSELGITASYNSTTHVLTLSGDASFANYETVLDTVTFQDTGTDNSIGSHPTRTLNWLISDGITTQNHTASDPNFRTTTLVIDRAPTVAADGYALLEGASASGTSGTGGTGVLGNDSDKDGDSIAVTEVNGVAGNVGHSVTGTYGHLTLNSDGSLSYSADQTSAIDGAASGSHPVDTFTYQVSDGLGGLTSSTVSFTIDRAPTVVTDTGTAVENASGTGNVLTNDSDKDGDSLTVSQVNGSAGNIGNSVAGTYGHITIGSNGSYTYNADDIAAIDGAATGSHLIDSFTYQANDGHGGATTATVTITLDRAPSAVNDANSVVESGSLNIDAASGVLANDSDRDGDGLTVSALTGGTVGTSKATTYGHITLNATGSYTYAADNTSAIDAAATGSHLTDTVSFTVSDGHGGTANETLTLTLDRAPTVATVSQTVFAGATFNGTAGVAGTGALQGDSDRDGDSLTITALTGGTGLPSDAGGASTTGSHGTLTLHADGSYSYVADAGAPDGSTDSFTYTVSDGHGGTSLQTLAITLDQAPNASGALATTDTTADFTASHQVNVELSLDKAVTVSAGTTISLSDGTTATYDAADSTTTDLVFTETVTTAPPTPGNLPKITGYTGSIEDAAHNPLNLGSGVTLSTYTVDVSDTAADVSAHFDSLDAAVADISDVHLSDGGTPDLDLTVSQALNDTALIALIEPSFDLIVNDTAAQVQAAIDNLESDSGIHAVTLTDAATPTITITQTQDAGDSAIIAKIQSAFDLMVTGASGTTPVPDLVTPEHYNAFEQFYDSGNVLTKTVYFNTDGTQSTVFDTASVSIDDSAGTTSQIYDLSSATSANVTGGSATDAFYFGGNFNAATDTLDGGGGVNQLALDGDYSGGNAITLGSGTITNIQSIALLGAHSYALTTVDANVPSGQTLAVWALNADSLIFNGAAETNGSFRVVATAGADTITGGQGNDIIYGMGGADSLTGGPGNDIFVYTAVADSTGTNASVTYDSVTDFNTANDKFHFPVSVTAIAPAIASGSLTLANFNGDLAAAVNASALPSHDAVLFTPSTGDAQFSGHTFLIVDANGVAGYQAGADYVIDVTGITGTLTHSDFI